MSGIILLSKLEETSLGTFTPHEIETFIKSLDCVTPKAKESKETNISVEYYDQKPGIKSQLKSILKSELNRYSTLLSGDKFTNFVFRIENTNLSDYQINEINRLASESKIKDRIERIKYFGGTLKFQQTESSIFGNNLTLIDSALPNILAEILYTFFTSGHYKVLDLVNKISIFNPLEFDLELNQPFYSYKVKHFLTELALGMMPSIVWTGQYDATGGYLIVKENGDVLCYHIYNRNEFEDYLLNHTKLETASSTRHGFGEIYKAEGQLYINLNLQIRFTK